MTSLALQYSGYFGNESSWQLAMKVTHFMLARGEPVCIPMTQWHFTTLTLRSDFTNLPLHASAVCSVNVFYILWDIINMEACIDHQWGFRS